MNIECYQQAQELRNNHLKDIVAEIKCTNYFITVNYMLLKFIVLAMGGRVVNSHNPSQCIV